MLPRSQRLTSRQFERAFHNAQTVRHPLVHLRISPRPGHGDQARAAFVVPKKQGKATARNRTRRRLRECYRLHPLRGSAALRGCDLLFFTTPATHSATTSQLNEALSEVLRRAAKRVAPAVAPPPTEKALSSSLEVAADEIEGESAEESAENPVGEPLNPAVRAALGLIRLYQRWISPSLPPACRFFPTCSRYTYEAIMRFGFWRGSFLGVSRVCRCHPWHPGGYDPVPLKGAPAQSPVNHTPASGPPNR